MNVIVYVEGKSDCLALESLFFDLLTAKQEQGVSIRFYPAPPEGDRKTVLLTKGPRRALNILRNQPESVVALVPDLSPSNKGFPHASKQELLQGIADIFKAEVERKGLSNLPDLSRRFQVFCFKHDMEVLLLAARERLAEYLACSGFAPDWAENVEEQNQDDPPSKVVARWFEKCGRRYNKTLDAREILRGADYRLVAERCPDCFQPLVAFLESCGARA
ncbi:MAG: DUF4276 family protein [Desulfarculus sp.]|nr:DUF4276 family protein [Desulfarculus sp.]